MGKKRFTFFEFHFHDGPYFEATANAPGAGVLADDSEGDADEGAEAADEGETCRGRSAAKAVLVLGLLAIVALLARRLLAGDEFEDEDEGLVYE